MHKKLVFLLKHLAIKKNFIKNLILLIIKTLHKKFKSNLGLIDFQKLLQLYNKRFILIIRNLVIMKWNYF